MKYEITVIEGDEMSAKLVKQGVKVLNAVAFVSESIFEFNYVKQSNSSNENRGAFIDQLKTDCLGSDAVIFGSSSVDKTEDLSKELGLFVASSSDEIRKTTNPVGTILSVAMLLDHLGLSGYAGFVRRAVNKSSAMGIESKESNPDNYLGTEAIGDYIAQFVKDIMEEPELVAWGAL